MMLLGRFEDGELHVSEQLVIVANQREVDFEGLGAGANEVAKILGLADNASASLPAIFFDDVKRGFHFLLMELC
jgi:hypothetical protein